MFRITGHIATEKYKPFVFTSVKWVRSVDNYSDTASIKIPAVSMLKTSGESYKVTTGLQFDEGMKIEVWAGYNGDNKQRFKGFVRRVNYTVPVEIECEGYSYQLRKKLNINKNYQNTTVKKILQDLVDGTDIKLSALIPDVPIAKAVFKNCTGTQVLDYLKDKCMLTVYFNYDELYCGLKYISPKKTVKLRLGWNVIKDADLKFNDKRELAEVRIKMVARKKNGTTSVSYFGPKDGQVIEKRISLITDEKTLTTIAEREKEKLQNRGYEGGLTLFLEPQINIGDALKIEDVRYPERAGLYFNTNASGEVGPSGGRQFPNLGVKLG